MRTNNKMAMYVWDYSFQVATFPTRKSAILKNEHRCVLGKIVSMLKAVACMQI